MKALATTVTLAVTVTLFGPEPLAVVAKAAPAGTNSRTVLGIKGTRFTLNDQPVFLLGFSYYGALAAAEDSIRQDLDAFQRRGFNWLRVWATWSAADEDVSSVDARGNPREPFLTRLKRLVAECDRRGLVVDVTLTRGKESAAGGRLTGFEAHRRAVETLVTALKAHGNWYLDLANERDVRDERYVSPLELKRLRGRVRQLDPPRLVTASFGGHDLSQEDLHEAVVTIGVDFLCPHRPRYPKSPGETEAQTRTCLALLAKLGRETPIHYQEPFRRGYTEWQPTAEDFLTDLRGAAAGGAAGWCFHNGAERGAGGRPLGRSFDLRHRRLMEQLDEEELRFVGLAAGALPASAAAKRTVFESPSRPRGRQRKVNRAEDLG